MAFEEVLAYSPLFLFISDLSFVANVTDNLQFCLNVHEIFPKVEHLVVFVEAEWPPKNHQFLQANPLFVNHHTLATILDANLWEHVGYRVIIGVQRLHLIGLFGNYKSFLHTQMWRSARCTHYRFFAHISKAKHSMCACVRTRSRFQVTQSRMLELRIHGRDNSFVTQNPLVLFTVCKRELPANPSDWLHLVMIFKCLRC